MANFQNFGRAGGTPKSTLFEKSFCRYFFKGQTPSFFTQANSNSKVGKLWDTLANTVHSMLPRKKMTSDKTQRTIYGQKMHRKKKKYQDVEQYYISMKKSDY